MPPRKRKRKREREEGKGADQFEKLLTSSPWRAFEEYPHRFNQERHVQSLRDSAVSRRLRTKEVIDHAKSAYESLTALYMRSPDAVSAVTAVAGTRASFIVAIVRAVLEHMNENDCDWRCASVLMVASDPGRTDCAIDRWHCLDEFFKKARELEEAGRVPVWPSEWTGPIPDGSNDDNRKSADEEFGSLATEPFLIDIVATIFGLRPTKEAILEHLDNKRHGLEYMCWILRLWESDESAYPATDPRYSFAESDACGRGAGAHGHANSVWSTFNFQLWDHVSTCDRVMARYSPDAPHTPLRALQAACHTRDARMRYECWCWPAPLKLCPHDGINTLRFWRDLNDVVLKWHIIRLTAANEITLGLRGHLLSELILLVLSYLTLDCAPRVRIPEVTCLTGSVADLQSDRDRHTAFLSAVKFAPSPNTPNIWSLPQ